MTSVAAAIKLLKDQMIDKLKADFALRASVSDRVYTLINPNDSRLYETFNKLPFIGISFPAAHTPEYHGGQSKDEDLLPRIWIYHENSNNKGQLLFDEIMEIADRTLAVLNYTIDFDPSLEIGEAQYSSFFGPESAVDDNHPFAARVAFDLIYVRSTVEVLV